MDVDGVPVNQEARDKEEFGNVHIKFNMDGLNNGSSLEARRCRGRML